MSIHQKPAFIQFVPTPKPRFRHAKKADGDAIWALRLKKNGHFLSFFYPIVIFWKPFLKQPITYNSIFALHIYLINFNQF